MFLLKEVDDLYNRFSERVFEAGVLDKKTKEIVAAAVSIAADCAPCLDWHYRQALAAGATHDEISEALAVAMSICAGSKRAKYGPVVSAIENPSDHQITA